MKEPHSPSNYKSVFGTTRNDHIIDEEQNHLNGIQNINNTNNDGTLCNTAGDDAEVLMHVFQSGHALTPVDHVTL